MCVGGFCCFVMWEQTTARVWLLGVHNRLRNDRLLTAGLFVKKKKKDHSFQSLTVLLKVHSTVPPHLTVEPGNNVL